MSSGGDDLGDFISCKRLFSAFFKLGMTAFGGPAMIAHMKAMVIKQHGWLDEGRFKKGIVLCQSIPGATAMQMAAYIGLMSGGWRGAVAAYAGFGLPAFLLMLVLSISYGASRGMPQVASLFGALQILVVAMLGQATFMFARETIKRPMDMILPVVCLALFGYGVSPFLVVAGSAIAGMVLFRSRDKTPGEAREGSNNNSTVAVRTIAVLLSTVCAGGILLYWMDKELFRLAAAMFRTDLFAFGGGFGALPLLFHEVVEVRGWLASGVFMDGVALGQVTPGPIVITAAFVGYLMHGILGAVVATMAIFTPSFLIMLAVNPLFEKIHGKPFFNGATRGILSSFVGMLAAMVMKFGGAVTWDPLRGLFLLGMAILLARKINILYVVLLAVLIAPVLFG